MNWIEIGDEIQQVHNNQLMVIAEFQKGMNVTLRSYIGTWEEIKAFRKDEIHNNYTHYMLVNRPKFKSNERDI